MFENANPTARGACCRPIAPRVGLSSVAAVYDRRRPQGRDAAPSGSHSRGSAAPVPSVGGL